MSKNFYFKLSSSELNQKKGTSRSLISKQLSENRHTRRHQKKMCEINAGVAMPRTH